MSFPVDFLIKSKIEFNVKDVSVKWCLKLISENVVNTIKKEGLFNINLEYNPETIVILNAKTDVTSYIQTFSQMNFADSENNIKFRLNLGRVLKFEKIKNEIVVNFKFHDVNPEFGFGINNPIISGVATISGEETTISKLERIFRKNLFVDDEFLIPICEKCKGLKSINGTTESIEELNDSSFICSECYTTTNNYCNLLINEFEKPLNFDNLNQKRSMFLDLIAKGKQYAKTIMETQLSHFFDVFYIYFEYVIGIFPKQETILRLNKLREFCKKNSYKKLEDYVGVILKKVETYGLQEQISPINPQGIQEIEDQNNSSNEIIDKGVIDQEKTSTSSLNFSLLIKQTLQGFEEILKKLNVSKPNLEPVGSSPLDRLRSINSSILREEGERNVKEYLSILPNIDLDKIDSLNSKLIFDKEVDQRKPKMKDISNEIPDHLLENIIKWIQILDENSELKDIPEEIIEILENKKVLKLTEQSPSSYNENGNELKSDIPSFNEDVNPSGRANLPPNFNPPGRANLPPNFNPPGRVNLPPNFNPPGKPNLILDSNPQRAANQPPGFNSPKKSSELKRKST